MRRPWARDELLIAFNLYCKTPFGRLHRHNPDVIRLAAELGRTASAVAMKLVNFASLDPNHQRRNVKGLRNASQSDRSIFAEFSSNWERLAYESEKASERVAEHAGQAKEASADVLALGLPTDCEQLVRVRLVQRFFRAAVLASYDYRCSVCRISLPELLNASHIIPWSRDVSRRADPTNGLAMCALHDRAFDRGLITVNDELRVVVARRIVVSEPPELHQVGLLKISGERIAMPERFQPDKRALQFHRQNVFFD